jgi:hypothetical protein
MSGDNFSLGGNLVPSLFDQSPLDAGLSDESGMQALLKALSKANWPVLNPLRRHLDPLATIPRFNLLLSLCLRVGQAASHQGNRPKLRHHPP